MSKSRLIKLLKSRVFWARQSRRHGAIRCIKSAVRSLTEARPIFDGSRLVRKQTTGFRIRVVVITLPAH
jgi:hypothetical protein